jgi:hypothetical protein
MVMRLSSKSQTAHNPNPNNNPKNDMSAFQSRNSPCQPTADIKQNSRIENELNRLSDLLDDAEKTKVQLRDRLSSVLTPVPANPEKNPPCDRVISSPVVERIESACHRLSALIRAERQLMEILET